MEDVRCHRRRSFKRGRHIFACDLNDWDGSLFLFMLHPAGRLDRKSSGHKSTRRHMVRNSKKDRGQGRGSFALHSEESDNAIRVLR